MRRLKSVIRAWLPLFFIQVCIFLLIYISTQQNYRQNANDPQIQIAEDNALALQSGKNIQDVIGQSQVDLNKSLATFIIIFDDSGNPVASQAVLDGRIPTPPAGVFEYTRVHKEDRVTWKPKSNIKIASIIKRYEGSKPGYILVGRSLREVELRVADLGQKLLLGALISIIGSFILVFILAG